MGFRAQDVNGRRPNQNSSEAALRVNALLRSNSDKPVEMGFSGRSVNSGRANQILEASRAPNQFASASKMRAQLRAPFWNDDSSYFSLGE